MSDNVKDLISMLLKKNPKKRLGYNGGIDEIISHLESKPSIKGEFVWQDKQNKYFAKCLSPQR